MNEEKEKEYLIVQIEEYQNLENSSKITAILSALGVGITSIVVAFSGKMLYDNFKLLDLVSGLGFAGIGLGHGTLIYLMVNKIVEKINYKGKKEELLKQIDEIENMLETSEEKGRNR